MHGPGGGPWGPTCARRPLAGDCLPGRTGSGAGRGLLPQLFKHRRARRGGLLIRSGLVSAKHLPHPKGAPPLRTQSAQSALAAYGTVQGWCCRCWASPRCCWGRCQGLLVPEVAGVPQAGRPWEAPVHDSPGGAFHPGAGMLCGGSAGGLWGRSGAGCSTAPGRPRSFCLLAPGPADVSGHGGGRGAQKGLGLQTASMRINILDAGVSLLLVWQLLPRVGLGAIFFTLYVSESMNLVLLAAAAAGETGCASPLYRSVLALALAAMLAVLLPGPLAGGGGTVAAPPAAGDTISSSGCWGASPGGMCAGCGGVLRGKPGERHGFFPKKVVK